MSNLSVVQQGDVLVVDSRLIADQLGIDHESFMRSIKKHQKTIEDGFEHLRFEIGTSQPNANGAVHETKYVLLTEAQATFVMTLSKNTQKVVQCKLNLVQSFEKAKSINSGMQPKAPQSLADACRQLADQLEENDRQAAIIAENAPKVHTYEAFIETDQWYTCSEVAMIIAVPKLGQRNLIAYLKKKHILTDDRKPYQEWVDKKMAKLLTDEMGYPYTVFSAKGMERIKDKLDEDGYQVVVRQQEIITYRHALPPAPRMKELVGSRK
jgi:phage regulator Rha-like protein